MTALVGREAELTIARAADAQPGRTGVVVVGPPGVGKTAFARALAAELTAGGRRLVSISGTRAAADIPLGAVAALLVLPTSNVSHTEMIRHTVESLAGRDGEPRPVVLVDDAHLLDVATATLVLHLAETGRVFVVVTLRSNEPVADAITALWKDERAPRIELDPLGADEARDLVERALGAFPDQETFEALYAISRGNPLYLLQLVELNRATGGRALRDRVAGRPPSLQLDVAGPASSGLTEAVRERFAGLDDAARELLELVAIAEPVGVVVLEAIGGPGTSERLAVLEDRQLIESVTSGRRFEVALAHPLYGEVLRAEMSAVDAGRARRRLAEVVNRFGRRRRYDCLRISLWSMDAGVAVPADVGYIAAEEALVLSGPELAAEVVQRIDDEEPSGSGASRLTTRLLLARIASLRGRAHQALAELDAIDVALDAVPDPTLRAHVALLRLDIVQFQMGRKQEAFELPFPADAERSLEAEFVARKAHQAVILMQPDVAASLLDGVTDVQPGTTADIWCSFVRGVICSAEGQCDDGLNWLDRAESAMDARGWIPSLPDPPNLLILRLRLLHLAGRAVEANALAERAIAFARDRWSEESGLYVRWLHSPCLRLQGRVDDALRDVQATMDFLAARHPGRRRPYAELAAALATVGDAAGARACADASKASGREPYYDVLADGYAAIAAGNVTAGVDALCAAEKMHRGNDAREELHVVLDVLRHGGAAAIVEPAEQLAARCDSHLAALAATWARGIDQRDADAIADVAAALAAREYHLPAAEAAVQAATLLLRARQPEQARAVMHRLRASGQRVAPLRTPGLVAPAVQATLSMREREVVALAARGEMTRTIAATLGLSDRTVEAYLRAAFTKLDASNRAELAVVCEAPAWD